MIGVRKDPQSQRNNVLRYRLQSRLPRTSTRHVLDLAPRVVLSPEVVGREGVCLGNRSGWYEKEDNQFGRNDSTVISQGKVPTESEGPRTWCIRR